MMIDPFAVKDCALISIATGERAQNLRELRDHLASTHPGCIYHHFWGGLLRPLFDDPEYQNDLAERMALIDPTEFSDLEDLRRELIEVIEERLDQSEWVPWAKASQQFHFIRSQIVVFDTRVRIKVPEKLAQLIPTLSVSSIFYHFIDARRRTPDKSDDLSYWLAGFGDRYADLLGHVAAIDPYFTSLTDLRSRLASLFRENMER
jgi:hypothetical protein